jgi:hypothetical protein
MCNVIVERPVKEKNYRGKGQLFFELILGKQAGYLITSSPELPQCRESAAAVG